MKKLIKILVILALIAGILAFTYRYFLSGKSSYQSIYLIPPDAALIIESDAAFEAWNDIIHSLAWTKISNIEYLAELNEEISSIDSMLSDKRFLLKILGHRKIMVSMHEYQSGKYDYLYVINIGKITQLRNPEKLLSSTLGNGYQITKRLYNTLPVYELLDKESGEMYIFSFLKEKVVFSTNYVLVESSIDEVDKMTLGRDLDFINVTKRISGRGLFNVYLNYRYFTSYLESTLGKSSDFVTRLDKELNYSAFSFEISPQGMIRLEGYTSVKDSVQSFYNSVMKAGDGSFQSSPIIPARVASMVKISLDDAQEYYDNSIQNLDQNEQEKYQQTLDKLEKKLKISVKDNFLSWIDDEIVLLQTQPSNLGRSNEFAAIITSKNKRDHKTNLDYISQQIERNTPVKIRKVKYGDYTISYISLPGILKALFGKMLGDIEKPYFTTIDKFVIFSNHPQTLKNIIDDYKAGNTLENSSEFNSFSKEFDRKNSALTYFDIPVLFENLKEFVDEETWQNLNKNKPYITCFPKAGVQIDNEDDLLHLMVKAKYSDQVEDYTKQKFDTYSFLQLFSDTKSQTQTKSAPDWFNPKIIIHDLDASKLEKLHENGTLKFTVGLKHGLLHGAYREYHPNGKLKVKGKYKDDLREGSWKLYDTKESLIEEKMFIAGKEEIK